MRLESAAMAIFLTGVTNGPVWAQEVETAPPAPPFLGAPQGLTPSGQQPQVLAALVVFVVTAAVLIAIAKLVDFRQARADATIVLEATIRDALLEDPAFIRSSVEPVAHIPFWRGSPARAEMHGQVPSRQLEQTALHLAAQAAASVRPDCAIENRLTLVLPAGRRAARTPVLDGKESLAEPRESAWAGPGRDHRAHTPRPEPAVRKAG